MKLGDVPINFIKSWALEWKANLGVQTRPLSECAAFLARKSGGTMKSLTNMIMSIYSIVNYVTGETTPLFTFISQDYKMSSAASE